MSNSLLFILAKTLILVKEPWAIDYGIGREEVIIITGL